MTPFQLQALNQEIQSLLKADETDTQRLAGLIDKRHFMIIEALKEMPQEDKKAFVEAELPINEYLNTFVGAMLKESGDILHSLTKGRKAVNKYKQNL